MRITERIVVLALVASAAVSGALAAQQRDLSLLYGSWAGTDLTTYEARLDRPLGSMLRHGVALQALSERRGSSRSFFGVGYELETPRGGTTIAVYGMASGALGLDADTAHQALAALWTVGMGLEWRPLRILGVGLEERYRVIDRGPHGFWQPGAPRKGFGTTLGITIGLGSSPHRSVATAATPPSLDATSATSATSATTYHPPSDAVQPSLMILSGRGMDVVETALDVLGSPYQWGGTADNGFDCSGLIQYAYARHGIRLPRTSRDQALAGNPVSMVVDSLLPGDILAFAGRVGGSVTHVGMYVGEGKFIHSSSTGVKLSRLDANDPEGSYWIPKWIGARRLVQ
ncbi:MAG TPA: C40 family peptidase [Gemmatimonadales bacterium]|nr:C40 family peptidase [Gemmatimonadales bacterium]